MSFWKFMEFRLLETLIGLVLASIVSVIVLISLLYKMRKEIQKRPD